MYQPIPHSYEMSGSVAIVKVTPVVTFSISFPLDFFVVIWNEPVVPV